ncbi:MAG TPA: hypothetical protein VFK04_05055 [Gemmatimonadaceae bacterium]|nr:hypothetical protein [Gemmatimonadaceae bacterium]
MKTDFVLRDVADEIRAANSVVILGAGVSILAGYPLTYHLRPLLWKAIEESQCARDTLARLLGHSITSAKDAVGDDADAVAIAFNAVKDDSTARAVFQHGFAALDADRTQAFSPAHDAVAELLHRRHVETVISLNWDTMLEAAYARRYGRQLRVDGRWLHKPHGNAAAPDGRWLYPSEAGQVPEALMEQLREMAAVRPRLLLIVGYSERDAVVVEQLIRPLEAQWRVVRIGPHAEGDLAIPLGADEALPRLRDAVVAGREDEVPGWEYVTFQSQNDLGAALDGRGLGPADTAACPRLTEVAVVRGALTAAHCVTIAGSPGSGKSMVAYHVAADLCNADWEVVRLADRHRSAVALIGALDRLPWRTAALVDDAQTVPPALLRALREQATVDRLVMLVTNEDPGDDRGVIHVSAERAVWTLATALLERRTETLAVLRRFDGRVGEEYGDIPLERRIAAARETSKFPWQFAFVLTAGERRARQHLATLRDRDRADLLLAIVAAQQLVTRDAGATESELVALATELGRDAEWVTEGLAALRRAWLLIDGERRRLPHLAYASASLTILLGDRRDPEWPTLVRMLGAACLIGNPPLNGVALLLREMRFADGMRQGSRSDTLVNAPTWRALATRLAAARSPAERNGAAYLLEALEGYVADRNNWIAEHAALLGEWITESTAESAYGLHTLLNDLINDDRELLVRVVEHVKPTPLAVRVSGAPLAEAYAWSALLGRLAFAGSDWRDSLGRALDRERMLLTAASATRADAQYVGGLAEAMRPYDGPLALKILQKGGDAIARFIESDPVAGYEWFDNIFRYVLGYYEAMFEAPEPDADQRAVARDLWSRVDPKVIAARLGTVSHRQLVSAGRLLIVLHKMAPEVWQAVMEGLDFDALDAATSDLWPTCPHELEEFVIGLARAEDREPASSWVARHAGAMRTIPARFVALAPDAAVASASGGAAIRLIGSGVLGWGLDTYILDLLGEREPALVAKVVEAHGATLAKEFLVPQKNQCEHLALFVAVVRALAPDALTRVLECVDPEAARANWAARLRGTQEEQEAAATLVDAARVCNGPIGQAAASLWEEFPDLDALVHRSDEETSENAGRAGAGGAPHSGDT